MNYFSTEGKSYGKPNEKLVDYAFRFLFSDKVNDMDFYMSFVEFVNRKYRRFGCAVIWEKSDSPFRSLIGQKEVIITHDCIRTTNDYRLYPQIALSL